MAGLALIAEFPTRDEARTRALAILTEHGQSPIVRRSGSAWGVFVSEALRDHLKAKRTSTHSAQPTATSAGNADPSNQVVAARVERIAVEKVAEHAKIDSNPEARPGSPGSKWSMSAEDAQRMASELRHAYRKLSREDATGWLNRTLKRFAYVFARRVQNLAGFALSVTEAAGNELIGLLKAVWENRAPEHLGKRIGHASGNAVGFARDVRDRATPLINDLRRDPANVAPDLLIGALAFYVVGGGFDGDGGEPDLDIPLLGIGAHRSIFTHSIIAGAVIETTLYSLIDFIGVAYRHLPARHHERWTLIHERLGSMTTASAKGASLGLAYHLGVDGLVQPGAYHGLPFEMPMEGHQAILTANAFAEALDIPLKEQRSSKASSATPAHASNNLKGIMAGAGVIAAWVMAEFV